MMTKYTGLMLLLLSIPCMAVEKITVVGLFKDKAIVHIDGKQRILTIGKTSPEGVKLISANSREAVIEIDGNQETYTLGTHISGEFTAPASGTTVTIAPDSTGMYEVNLTTHPFFL